MDNDALLRAIEDLISRFDTNSAALGNYQQRTQTADEKFKKSTEGITKELGKLDKAVEKGRKKYGDLGAAIENLEDQIDDLADGVDDVGKLELKRKVATLKEIDSRAKANAIITDGTKKTFSALGKTSTETVMQAGMAFTKALQSNSSGVEAATGIFTSAIDLAAGAGSAAGGLMSVFGTGLQEFGGAKLKVLGFALDKLGIGLDFASEAAGKLAKFGVEVLSKEVERTVKAYKDSTSAGALFADGMMGLRKAAHSAELDTSTFANVLKKNSTMISQSGLGMIAGTAELGKVAKELKSQNLRGQLQNLGFGLEEQVDIAAQVMADMTRLQPGQRANSAEVAQETAKYAENLRLISSITGEDAKAKIEASRNQANQLAFQQKLAQKTPEQRAAITRAMSHMTSQQQANFMDMVNFGKVINKKGAQLEAVLPEQAAMTQEMYGLYLQNKMNETEAVKVNAAHQDALHKQVISATGIAQAGAAGSSLANELSAAMLETMQYVDKHTKESVEAGLGGLAAAKNTTDEFTQSVHKADLAMMDLKVKMEDALAPAITKYTEVTVALLEVLKDQLKDLGIKVPGEKVLSENEAVGRSRGEMAGGLTGTAIGAVLGAYLGPLGAIAGGLAGGWAGEKIGGWSGEKIGGLYDTPGSSRSPTEKARPKSTPSMALGGVAQGATSGYSATLHGTEAVIPLGQGKKIPVEPTTTGVSEVMQLKEIMVEQLATMKEYVRKADQLISSADDQRRISQGILNNSY